MKMGLKKRLNDEIRKKGYMTIQQIHDFAKSLNQKESTAERRLRASESPNIETVRNKKGFNIGYKYREVEAEIFPIDERVINEDRLFAVDERVVSEKDMTKYL